MTGKDGYKREAGDNEGLVSGRYPRQSQEARNKRILNGVSRLQM